MNNIELLLILGAGGLVGSNLYRTAIKRGYKVVATTRRDGQIEDSVFFDFATGNPKDLSKFIIDPNKTCAIIAGGITNIGYCFVHKDEVKAVNVDGTIRLLRYFNDIGVKTVWFSSDQVFDGIKGDYSEDDIVNPICEYGRSKMIVEQFVLQNLPDTLIYRIPKQYDNTLSNKNLFSEIKNELETNGIIRNIQGLVYNPTYVKDTVECVIKGIENGLYGLYNVASPQCIPRHEISKVLLSKMGITVDKSIRVPLESLTFLKEPKALNTTMNTDKFARAIGYRFRDYRDIIAVSEGIKS